MLLLRHRWRLYVKPLLLADSRNQRLNHPRLREKNKRLQLPEILFLGRLGLRFK